MEIIDIEYSEGKIYADINVHCPPAVPIIIIGEKITKETIQAFKYYGIEKIKVVK